jgi:hypothetical protein
MADATLTGISDLAAGMLSVVTAAVVSLACRPREVAASVDAATARSDHPTDSASNAPVSRPGGTTVGPVYHVYADTTRVSSRPAVSTDGAALHHGASSPSAVDTAGAADDGIIMYVPGPQDVAGPGVEVVVVDGMTGFGLVTIMATLGGPAHLARAETANTRPTTGASVRHVVRRFHTAAADVKPPRPPSNATPDGRLAAYRARARDVGFPRGRGWWPEGIRAGISYRNWHTIRSRITGKVWRHSEIHEFPGTAGAAADMTGSSATCPVGRGCAGTMPASPTLVRASHPDQPVVEVWNASTVSACLTAPVPCRNSIGC